jgi:hypothetical protein
VEPFAAVIASVAKQSSGREPSKQGAAYFCAPYPAAFTTSRLLRSARNDGSDS